MLYTQTVTAETLALTKRLMADSRLNDFLLVGGTALALTIGHRLSIDIDLFTHKDFDPDKIAKLLEDDYRADNIKVLNRAVFCLIDNIKTDIICHEYPILQTPKTIEGIRLISLQDIAAMKLNAIVQNGSRIKDFTDIYFMLEKIPLADMYEAYEQKYPNASRVTASIGLRYHSSIDHSNEVVLLREKIEWSRIASRLFEAVEKPDKQFLDTRISFEPKMKVQIKPRKKRGRGI